MRYIFLCMVASVFGSAVKATPSFEVIKDLSAPFVNKKYAHLNPVNGVEETALRNQRNHGHYGSTSHPEFPRYDLHSAIAANAEAFPQDATAALIQRLFPSPDGFVFVANSVMTEPLNKWLSPKNIGKVLSTIKDPENFIGDMAKENETLKTLITIFQPDFIQKNKKKLVRLEKKPKELNTLLAQSEAGAFSKLLISALKENAGTHHTYTSHPVEQSLLDYMWQKASQKSELKPFYEALAEGGVVDRSKLQEINWGEDLTPEITKNLLSQYDKEEHLKEKQKLLDNPQTLKDLSQDPSHLTLLGLGYTYYEDLLPPQVNYQSSLYNGKTFSNCVETSIRNFFNARLYNEKGGFDVNSLRKLEDLGLKPSHSLIQYYENITPTTSNIITPDAHDKWNEVVSNRNNPSDPDPIVYVKEDTYEIKAELSNILRVIGKVLNDPQWKPMNVSGPALETAIQDNLDRLCTLFSPSSQKPLTWQVEGAAEDHKVSDPTNLSLTFLSANKPIFQWTIYPGHAYFTKIDQGNDWRPKIGERLVKEGLIKEWLPAYTYFKPYDATNIDQIPPDQAESIFAGVLYSGDLDSIDGKINALRQISVFKKTFHNNSFDTLIDKWIEPTGRYFANWQDGATNGYLLNALGSVKSVQEIRDLKIEPLNKIISPENSEEITINYAYNVYQFKTHPELVVSFLEDDNILELDELKYKTCLQFALQMGLETPFKKLVKHSRYNKEMGREWLVAAIQEIENKTRKGQVVDLGIVKTLLEGGADTEVIHNDMTALRRACYMQNEPLIKLLIEAGANLNVKLPGGGYTVLQEAILENKKSVVELLLRYEGVDINSQADNGWTALDLCNFSYGSPEIRQLLLAHGAKSGVSTIATQ